MYKHVRMSFSPKKFFEDQQLLIWCKIDNIFWQLDTLVQRSVIVVFTMPTCATACKRPKPFMPPDIACISGQYSV